MQNRVMVLAVLAVTCGWADSQFHVKHMTRTDVPAGKGQCDIRLQVDDTVEVAVRGDSVQLHTLAGREARDDGSECNFPLPSHEIRGFGFQVVDSRNEIRKIQDPDRGNEFTVVVRIRDTEGGYGRYHFRLTWAIEGRPDPDRPAGDGFAWNNVAHYEGRGAGLAVTNDADQRRLSNVSVDIDRGGHAIVSFQTERRGFAFLLNGVVIGREGDRLKIDAMTDDRRLRGTLWVSVAEGSETVRTIDMDGTDGRDRMRVHWERR